MMDIVKGVVVMPNGYVGLFADLLLKIRDGIKIYSKLFIL
jgi:hypothetical protein